MVADLSFLLILLVGIAEGKLTRLAFYLTLPNTGKRTVDSIAIITLTTGNSFPAKSWGLRSLIYFFEYLDRFSCYNVIDSVYQLCSGLSIGFL